MRIDYKLSDQTRRILDGNIKAIADAMDVTDKFLYAIMAGNQTDPFAVFERLYKACVIAGVDTADWDNRMAGLRETYAKPTVADLTFQTKLIAKVKADADSTNELLKAIEDGTIDQIEARKVINQIQKQEDTTAAIKNKLLRIVGDDSIRSVA